LLRVKGLVICFYLGLSGSILQFRQNIINVDSKSWLLTCSSNITLSLHCNPLQGNYRFFTGISLYSNSTRTCFGSVQGLKGQISLKYREIYEFCTGISILYLRSCLCFYNRDFLFFEKQQHENLPKQGKPCKFDRRKNVNKTGKQCNQYRGKMLLKEEKPCN
jgi:hypothetical protein